MSARFNLVCHGLMAFVRRQSGAIEILIPDETSHVVKVGHPRGSCEAPQGHAYIPELPHGDDWQLHGVNDGGLAASDFLTMFTGPILDGKDFESLPSRHSQIVTPPPAGVRSYRVAEADQPKMEGDTTSRFFEKRTSLLSEVTVLWWNTESSDPDSVWIGSPNVKGFRAEAQSSSACSDSASADDRFMSLCLYSQPSGEACGEEPSHGHGSSWNSMFRIAGTMGGKLDMHLALMDAIPDPPPPCTAIGIECQRLLSLCEMEMDTSKPNTKTSRAGCGGGGVSC